MINLEIAIPIMIFAFVSSATPGPNNLMVMASATNFGFRKTIPHIFGINLGFAFMLFMMGLGLNTVFKAYPLLEQIIKIVCIVYLIVLAYKISQSSGVKNQESSSKPIGFFEAALFQWVNPKAWAMALTAVSLFSSDGTIVSLVFMVIVFSIVNFPCVSMWSFAGSKLSKVLKTPRTLKYFNYTMATLLLGCLFFLL